MEDYIHRVQYYETDQMGVVHHSNHIRWMEEARIAFLDALGIGFVTLEARGIYSPVVGVECRYRRPAHFGERILVHVELREYKGMHLRVEYRMIRVGDEELIATGSSTHCFTNTAGRPIALSKTHPDIDAVLAAAVAAPDPAPSEG